MKETPGFTWKFHHQGGQEQVILSTAEEIRRLPELDPKLWTALSCPACGLEFDSRTLALIDADHDGRIRIPEVVEAVQWICARVKDPATIIDPPPDLPLSVIDDQSEAGRHLLTVAQVILENMDKSEAASLTEADVLNAVAQAGDNTFNGDGILPPLDSLEPETRLFIKDALAVMGGVKDVNGLPGLNRELAGAFIEALADWKGWKKKLASAGLLGEDTPEAWALLEQLKDKVNDYFLRCEIASFVPQATTALNADDLLTASREQGPLEVSVLSELPLARVAAECPLASVGGLNPAWSGPVKRFLTLVKPLLAEPEIMTSRDWLKIQDSFAAYVDVLADKPALKPMAVDFPPTSDLDQLGPERIEEIISSHIRERFDELAREDADTPAASSDIAQLERLFFYHRHLYRLLMNFVSFHDFYTEGRLAAFQAGTLYLDGRSCSLCMPVTDVEAHAALAVYSHLCLVYCECRRTRRAGEEDNGPDGTMTIVAAVTAGNSELLLAGRNGVFIDNVDNDWDARVIKVVSNPIGLMEAIWAPYLRLGRMISEQAEKLAGAGNDKIMASASQVISKPITAPASAPAPAAPAATGAAAAAPTGGAAKPPFDIGRNVGIFAAVGLALGALGTALASIAKSVLALEWWQMPLLLLAIFLLISGPSVVLAWLKLRKRTLGLFLEASGWAVNNGVIIDLALSRKLTGAAVWPPDAYQSRGELTKPLLLILLLVILAWIILNWWP